MDRVLGSVMDAKMDANVSWGFNRNKMLKNRLPSKNALPKDSFLRMHISTRKKTIIILMMAGMCSNRVMFANLSKAVFAVAKLNQTRQITESAHQIKTQVISLRSSTRRRRMMEQWNDGILGTFVSIYYRNYEMFS